MKQFKLMSLALLGIVASGQICAADEDVHPFKSVPVLQARVNAGDAMGALAIAKNFLSGVDTPVHIGAEEIAVEKLCVFNWLSVVGNQGCLPYLLAYLRYMPSVKTSCPEEGLVHLRYNAQCSAKILQHMFTFIDYVRDIRGVEPIYPYFQEMIEKSLKASRPMSQVPVRKAASWLGARRFEISDGDSAIAQNMLRSLDILIRASSHEDGRLLFGKGNQVDETIGADVIVALLRDLDTAVEQLLADADGIKISSKERDGSGSDDEDEFEAVVVVTEGGEGVTVEAGAQDETTPSWTYSGVACNVAYNVFTAGGLLDYRTYGAAPVAQDADEGGADEGGEGSGSGDQGGVDPQFEDAAE